MRASATRLAAGVAFAFITAAACGGGGGGGTPTPSPPPTPTPPSAANPCLAPAIESLDAPDAPAPAPGTLHPAPGAPPGKRVLDPSPEDALLNSIWAHNAAVARGAIRPFVSADVVAEDIGDVAVLQDRNDIIIGANRFDLNGVGLRFTRNGSGGYNVQRIDAAFRSPLGSVITLTDDDSQQQAIGFSFPFYAKSHGAVFINSDGNLTFEEEDKASTLRSIARLLNGPPRASPFFTDLDPSTGGRVLARAAADQFTVTWCGVRAFESDRATTVQVSLLPDGTIEMKFADNITVPSTIVGLSPGNTASLVTADLSAATSTSGGAAAIAERFLDRSQLDLVATIRQFYATHPDNYDQVVIWTDQRLLDDDNAFAFALITSNEVRGIGLNLFDSSRDFGSSGRLRSVVMMDTLTKYPDDPTQRFLGENNTLSVLGQEIGHRWLAYLEFRDHTGQQSQALLGREEAHWSFFFDSDASVAEGNDIEDLGGGSFRTVGTVQRYSLLDQYAMGFVSEAQVPRFFYVESPTNVIPPRAPESSPSVGVTFTGTRRDVLIQDVVAVMGPRQPSAAEASKLVRLAFIYVVSNGRSVDAGQVGKVDRIRRQWEDFFARATDTRARAETRLRPPT